MGSNGKRKGKKGKQGTAPHGKASSSVNGTPPEANEPADDEARAGDGGDEPGEAEPASEAPNGDGEKAEAVPPPPPPATHGAAWGAPLLKLDNKWTWLEARLLVIVLFAELGALVAWVMLNDLTEPPDKAGSDGTVFRAMLGALALGCGGWFASRKMSLTARRALAIGGIVVGALCAPAWRTLGVAYLDNVKGWLQEGSTLTLMGGLRGVATRLTLWLALLGGSVATGAGRHIHIDLVYRLIPQRFRLPASIFNACAAALVCFAGVWGFVDHIAINSFGSKAEDTAGEKIAKTLHEVGDDLYLARRQVGLDFRSLPHVLGGERYDQWMTGKAWNAWVDGGGFEDRWSGPEVAGIKVPDDTPTHAPLVIAPDGKATRGLLVHVLGLVFPFGLFAIGLRFVLRALLTASGHYSTDPDEAHREDLGGHAEGGA